MQKKDCYFLGYISKIIGTNGEVAIFIDADNPSKYNNLKYILVEINEQLIPYFISSIKINGSSARVLFEDVDSTEKAQSLTSKQLFLPLEMLPELKGNKFYFHEVIGFTVIDKVKGNIGTIASIIESTSNPIMQIIYNEKEILIPIIKNVIKKVDRENKTIEIEAPEGLIDIYLELN